MIVAALFLFSDNEGMNSQLLPIFPLPLVLLPGMPLPLHVFEDRYKEMMADILPDNREFGIVFAKDEGIVNIGCTATVQKVVRRYEDGRLDLLASGQRRFEIDSLNEDRTYLQAEVEYFDDEEEENIPRDLKEKALLAFGQLQGNEEPPNLQAPARSSRLSFQIARLVKDLDERQTVLALRSENERLEHLVRLVPSYLAQQEKIALAKRVAPLNGHAKHVVTS
jgi:Lon protease-like protein